MDSALVNFMLNDENTVNLKDGLIKDSKCGGYLYSFIELEGQIERSD